MPTYLDQGYNAQSVTPSNTTDLSLAGGTFSNPQTTGALLFVGTGGNIQVTMVGGQTVVFNNIADGTFLPIQVKRVWATNTTATDIVAIF